jgi:CheY-like chemotaxis protein
VEILLVEDSPTDIELMIEALRDGKVVNHISVVNDGVSAVEFLQRAGAFGEAPRPDLILLDLNLPKKNGFQVLKEIKDDPKLARIPVVVLTSSESERDILRSYDLRANSFVSKPFFPAEFLTAVQGLGEFWLAIVKLPLE